MMSGISPLDLLYARRQILAGDLGGGHYFGYLSRRRNEKRHQALYQAAEAMLQQAGVLDIVEAVVLNGQMPRTERGLSRLLTGLDLLNRFWKENEPRIRFKVSPGCRPARKIAA